MYVKDPSELKTDSVPFVGSVVFIAVSGSFSVSVSLVSIPGAVIVSVVSSEVV